MNSHTDRENEMALYELTTSDGRIVRVVTENGSDYAVTINETVKEFHQHFENAVLAADSLVRGIEFDLRWMA
jgi:hypothetical protein